MPIELTEAQRDAVRGQTGPLELVDPQTQRRYFLIAAEQFDLAREVLEEPDHTPHPDIPPGILASQKAYWQALPGLLEKKRNRGKWVAYQGDILIGIAAKEIELMREIVNRGIADDAYYIDRIEPSDTPPWGTFEYESSLHFTAGQDESGTS